MMLEITLNFTYNVFKAWEREILMLEMGIAENELFCYWCSLRKKWVGNLV